MLFLDDLDLADAATRQVVRRLVPLLPGSRLLLVVAGTAVADAPHPWDDLGFALDLRVPVAPLTEQEVAGLVALRLGTATPPARLVARATVCCAGNVLALQEYLQAVLEAGLIRPFWGTWCSTRTRRTLWRCRTTSWFSWDGGWRSCRHRPGDYLTLAAVLGARFDPEMLAEVAAAVGDGGLTAVGDGGLTAVGDGGLTAALAEAAGRQLVERVGADLAFVHSRIREVLLAALSAEELRDLHQTVAEAMGRRYGQAAAQTPSLTYAQARHWLSGRPSGSRGLPSPR